MAKKNDNRGFIDLKCSECNTVTGRKTEKNKKNTTEKLELNLYCKACRKHTKHIETKSK